MKASKRYLIALIFLVLLFQNFVNTSTSSEEEKIVLVYFHTTGCTGCKSIDPAIDEIQQQYKNNVAVNKLLVLYDLNSENYTIWKKFGFEYLPSAVVINPTDTSCKTFPFENLTKENIVSEIQRILDAENLEHEMSPNNLNANMFLAVAIIAICMVLIFVFKKKNDFKK